MYTDYFGFRGEPFTDTADLDCYYSNAIYRKAHATLLAGIRENKGFLLLTGEAGTGKTTLLRRLMKDVAASGHSVFFDSTSLASATIDDVLYFLCAELGLHGEDNRRVEKLRLFSAYLHTLDSKGATSVLLIDEAQQLSDDVLGGLRMIAPIDMKSERLLLQIVLVGQPELEQRLTQPNLRPIQQRVALRCRLDRLTDEEIPAYIHQRLQAVGCERRDLFAAEALQRIASSSHGVPRLINIICDNALLIAYCAGDRAVSEHSVDEAVANLPIAESMFALHPATDESLIPAVQSSVALQWAQSAKVASSFLQSDKLNGDGSLVNVAVPPRRSVKEYLVAGFLLVVGAGAMLFAQRGTFSSLFTPPALTISQAHPTGTDGQRVIIPEGQTQAFSVEAASAQTDSLQYVWFVNGQEQGRGPRWTYQPQFDEGGQSKTVTARVTDRSRQTVERHWTVQIQDVNRPPQIVNVTPTGAEVVLQHEKTSQLFTVTVEDLDTDQPVETTWFLDGQKVAQGQQWTFSVSPTMDEGSHSVKVTGRDSAGASIERQWIVTVLRIAPKPPHIIRTQPVSTTLNIAEGQQTTFAVEVDNPHPEMRYVWLIDGQERSQEQRWTYQPQFTEGGQEKTVTVQVKSPGVPSEERHWKVAIIEVNRPPVITITEPKRQTLQLRIGEEQRFTVVMADPDPSDRVTAVWSFDGKEVAQGPTWTFSPTPGTEEARHTVSVAVSDQDGMTEKKQWRVAIAGPVVLPLQLTTVQPTTPVLSLTVGQEVVFAVEVAKGHAGVEYAWLVNGQEQSRERTWTYAPQAEDGRTRKTVTVRVRDANNQLVERNWQVRILAESVAPAPPAPVALAPTPPPAVESPLRLLLNEAEVRTWVEAQRQALEGRNVNVLIELGALNNQQAERAREILSQYKNFQVAFRNIAIHIEGNRAEVSFSRVDTIEGIEVPHPDRKRFILQKGENGRMSARPQR